MGVKKCKATSFGSKNFDFCEILKILLLEAAAVTKRSFARYSRQIPYFNAVLHDTLIKILTCSAPTTTTTPALLPTIAQARLRNRSGLGGCIPQTPLTVRHGPGRSGLGGSVPPDPPHGPGRSGGVGPGPMGPKDPWDPFFCNTMVIQSLSFYFLGHLASV